MNWGFHDNRFPELCSGKSFIFAKAYFSDCIVSSVLIEACRRTTNSGELIDSTSAIGIVEEDIFGPTFSIDIEAEKFRKYLK